MRRSLLAIPVLLFGTAVHAADIAEPIVETPMAGDWTGFYAGVQLGGAFGSDPEGINFSPLTPTLATAFSPSGAVPDAGFSGDFDNGLIGGLHVGYDHQFANGFVVGGIVDVSFTDIGDFQRGRSRTPANYDFTRELDVLVTGRARLGYAVDRFLPYVTGGVAYGNLESRYTDTSAATIQSLSDEDDAVGYTVGGGVETMITQRLSLGVEYLYTNLGDDAASVNLAGPAPGNPFGTIGGPGTTLSGEDEDFDFHTVQVKLSYRF